MKYVVIRRTLGTVVQEFPVIFPDDLPHRDVAEAIGFVVSRLPPKDTVVNGPVSAGQVIFEKAPHCYGWSAGLTLDSRPTDSTLIFTMDSTNGIQLERAAS